MGHISMGVRLMKTKRFLMLLAAGITLISVSIALFLHKPRVETVNVLYAEEADEIDLFYYRSVPGLKQAEDLGLVKPVNRAFDLSGSKGRLIIDRIWYSNKGISIFYHVENLDTLCYLGGDLYLPGNEPDVKTINWGEDSIGTRNEKGIIYNGEFYSCLRLPHVTAAGGRPADNIGNILFKPYLSVYPSRSAESADDPQVFSLKAFSIPLDYNSEDEPVTKTALDSWIQLDGRRLAFYQADLAPSVVRIYCQFLNSGRERITSIKGNYKTDKGEMHSFEAVPSLLTTYPYHYFFEVPPFHTIPGEVTLYIESLRIQGRDRLEMTVEPVSYGDRPKKHIIEQTKDTLHNTAVVLKSIDTGPEMVSISIEFIAGKPDRETFTLLDVGFPAPEGSFLPEYLTGELPQKPSNTLSIINNELRSYDFAGMPLEIASIPGESLKIGISRQYWDKSKSIRIALEDLSYLYIINKEASLVLEP